KLGSLILILVIVVFLAPVLAREIFGLDLKDLQIFSSTTVDISENFQVAISEIEMIEELALAEYHGVVFLRESIPVKFLGFSIYDIELWKHIPGVVRASIDLSGYDLNEHVYFEEGIVYLMLPEPSIDTCELIFNEIAEGISLSPLPLESATDIGLVEDAMYESARVQLIEKALAAGILDIAEEQAVCDIDALIKTVCGDEISVEVEFTTEGSDDG
ncbi:MAG: DUF4230 domain-containing protein, partial [Candidatus Aegiribacteria sp.]|nr:DUF4230 domain-containing protein [Candidatus Aegiribacteria sp.]